MAALLSLGIAFFFSKKLSMRRAHAATTQIVTTTGELPSGITLAAKDVTLVDWPSDFPLQGSYSKVEDVIGHPLLNALGSKEPILKRNLGLEGSGIGLSGRIPPGMRATAVRSNEIVGVAGFLYPGSHVDVLVTYTPPGGNNIPVTETVLQDVEVLTAGQTTEPDPQGKPQTVNVVTLLLNPEDSQRLQLASMQGGIQFVLRSGVDQKSVNLKPTRLDQLVASEKPPVVVPPSTKKAPKRIEPSRPTIYVLEVIQGTKRSVEKF
ncbi:MAG: Flp pilus assembly protein CpaB [Acidobacteria bacterium]|nr:MAG: Flp pilus assembly protein CpaB [Acidobacteriota bacterium]